MLSLVQRHHALVFAHIRQQIAFDAPLRTLINSFQMLFSYFCGNFEGILHRKLTCRIETEKWEGTERHIVKQLRLKNSFLMKITQGIKNKYERWQQIIKMRETTQSCSSKPA